MKEIKVFKNASKYKLIATAFSLALVTSMSIGCAENQNEAGYYITYTETGKEVVLTTEQYNELIDSDKNEVIIRSYGGTITITKKNLQEATYKKEMPNSLHK